MQLFRYREDRLPAALIAALSISDLLVYWFVDNLALVFVWMLLGIVPKICVCAWNHHHQHVPTFRVTALNRLLELLYTFHTGITTNAWVLHHNLGHHLNYLDQAKDESGWKRSDGAVMDPFEYTMTIAFTGYLRAFRVGRHHPKHQGAFIWMTVLSLTLICALLYHSWINALLVYLLPMATGYIATCWHTYFHHAGLDSDDPLEASYNILHRGYNLMTGNLGYHTAHHMKQGLHWSKLPEFHREIEARIPPGLYRAPSVPFCWFPG